MGLIEAKTYTSAAEIHADAIARRERLWGRPVVRNILVHPTEPEEQHHDGSRADPWLARTPEQRCSLIRDMWTPGCSMQEVANRIECRLGRKMSKAIIQSHMHNYKAKHLRDVVFNSDSGYRSTYDTMSKVDPTGLSSGQYFKALCLSVHIPTEEAVKEIKNRDGSRIRQVAAYLIRKHYPNITFYGVGMIINRDPSTAKSSIKRVDRLVRKWGVADLKGWLND